MLDDLELIRKYAAEGSDDAFRTIVERHIGLVYSAALRQVRDPHLAEEVTQAVFVVLARKAGSLKSGTLLVGWLFRTTRFVAARAVRDRQLRQLREQEAAQMEHCLSASNHDAAWQEVAPTLDEAIAKLGETDRHAVLLRFFEKKELKEVGRALGSSEDAAKKRVSRALEKLRAFLVRRGITLSTVTLAGALVENSVHAAPAALSASTLAAVTMNAGTATTVALVQGTIKAMFYAKLKAGALATVVVLGIIGTGLGTASLFHHTGTPLFFSLPLEKVDGMPLASFGPENLWSCLPTGQQTLGGVPFDIKMRMQLHGNLDAKELRRYPASIMGIPVRQRLARLHLLQGANITDTEGRPIAALRLHYSGGKTHTLFLNYGVHTREWWHYSNERLSTVSASNTAVVWRGRSADGDRRGATHRMFKTTFDLPASDERVESMDALSLFSRSSLVILAITGEAGQGVVPREEISPGVDQFRDSTDLMVFDQAGQPIRGVRVFGAAQAGNGTEITLGKLDDTFSTAGLVPVDFPAGARQLKLRVTAAGYVPTEVTIVARADGRFEPRVVAHLPAANVRPRVTSRETREEAQAARDAAQPAYELKRSDFFREAIPAFETAIRQYPNHSDSYHGLAQAQRESGNPQAALANHDRAIELDPRRHDLYWERGLTYLRMHNYDDAIADFNAALKRNSQFALAEMSLGEAYRGKQDFELALLHQNNAIALKPETAWFYHERGNTYRRMGDSKRAGMDYAKAIELRNEPAPRSATSKADDALNIRRVTATQE